jgi:hypothetical protein
MAANVFVLLYLIAHSIRPISDRLMAWVIFLLCALVGVLVAFLWNQTVTIGGEQWRSETSPTHVEVIPRALTVWLVVLWRCCASSYVLLFLAFIAGLAGNTSTLVFFAFASNYLPILTSALSAGYGTLHTPAIRPDVGASRDLTLCRRQQRSGGGCHTPRARHRRVRRYGLLSRSRGNRALACQHACTRSHHNAEQRNAAQLTHHTSRLDDGRSIGWHRSWAGGVPAGEQHQARAIAQDLPL